MFIKKKSKIIKRIIFYNFALFFCIKSSENFKSITIYIGGIEINSQNSKSTGTNFLPNKTKEKIENDASFNKNFFPAAIKIKKAFLIGIFFASFFIIKIIKNKIKNFSFFDFLNQIQKNNYLN